jgi:hypothetical protein
MNLRKGCWILLSIVPLWRGSALAQERAPSDDGCAVRVVNGTHHAIVVAGQRRSLGPRDSTFVPASCDPLLAEVLAFDKPGWDSAPPRVAYIRIEQGPAADRHALFEADLFEPWPGRIVFSTHGPCLGNGPRGSLVVGAVIPDPTFVWPETLRFRLAGGSEDGVADGLGRFAVDCVPTRARLVVEGLGLETEQRVEPAASPIVVRFPSGTIGPQGPGRGDRVCVSTPATRQSAGALMGALGFVAGAGIALVLRDGFDTRAAVIGGVVGAVVGSQVGSDANRKDPPCRGSSR